MSADVSLQAAAQTFAREVGAPTTPCADCGCEIYQPYDDTHECANCGLPFGAAADEDDDAEEPPALVLVGCYERPHAPFIDVEVDYHGERHFVVLHEVSGKVAQIRCKHESPLRVQAFAVQAWEACPGKERILVKARAQA